MPSAKPNSPPSWKHLPGAKTPGPTGGSDRSRSASGGPGVTHRHRDGCRRPLLPLRRGNRSGQPAASAGSAPDFHRARSPADLPTQSSTRFLTSLYHCTTMTDQIRNASAQRLQQYSGVTQIVTQTVTPKARSRPHSPARGPAVKPVTALPSPADKRGI